MLNDASFISGVWCGMIFGAAGVMLIVSLMVENRHRKHERQLQRVRDLFQQD